MTRNKLYTPVASAICFFLGWTHCHTDELPFVFTMVALAAALLGALRPSRALLSGLLAGAPVPVTETLVRFGFVHATWPRAEASPAAALVAFVPAAIGLALGVALGKRLSDNEKFA